MCLITWADLLLCQWGNNSFWWLHQVPMDEVIISRKVIIYFPRYYLLYVYLKNTRYFPRMYGLRTEKEKLCNIMYDKEN